MKGLVIFGRAELFIIYNLNKYYIYKYFERRLKKGTRNMKNNSINFLHSKKVFLNPYHI